MLDSVLTSRDVYVTTCHHSSGRCHLHATVGAAAGILLLLLLSSFFFFFLLSSFFFFFFFSCLKNIFHLLFWTFPMWRIAVAKCMKFIKFLYVRIRYGFRHLGASPFEGKKYFAHESVPRFQRPGTDASRENIETIIRKVICHFCCFCLYIHQRYIRSLSSHTRAYITLLTRATKVLGVGVCYSSLITGHAY